MHDPIRSLAVALQDIVGDCGERTIFLNSLPTAIPERFIVSISFVTPASAGIFVRAGCGGR
jgi:hypothetical protein